MEKLSQKILKKTLHILSKLLFYTVVFIMLVFTVANLNVRQTSDIANVFGSGFHSIESELISGEQSPSLTKDIVLVKMIDESLLNELKIGDVITYYDETSHQLVTHRIIEINLWEGTLYFTTQGNQSLTIDEPIDANHVLAVYQSSITGLGAFLDYLQSPVGFAILVILPVLVMMIIESIRFYESILNYQKLKSAARVKKSYRRILKHLEFETNRIRHEVMSNWMTETDYEKIVKLRI